MFDSKSRDIAINSGLGVLVLMVVGLAIMFAVQTAPHDVLEEVQAFRVEINQQQLDVHAEVQAFRLEIRTEQNLLHEEIYQRETITDSIRNRQDVLSLRIERNLNEREQLSEKLWQLIDANESLIAPDSWERPKD